MSDAAPDLGAIDVDRYDFDELRADITAILDIQSAVVTTLKWSVVLPIVGAFVAWSVFEPRTSRWLLIPFMFVLGGAMLLAAVNIGIMFTLRNRLAQTNAAADRVITTTETIHADYLRIRRGDADVPMGDLARMLTRELVFPALTASGTAAFATATTASGPVGWLVGRLAKYPMQMVEQRVLDALGAPESGHTPVHDDDPPTDVETLAEDAVEALEGVRDFYGKVHRYLDTVVGGFGVVATGSLGTVLAVSLVPLVALLAFGWYVL